MITVDLRDETAAEVERRVKTGEYATADEVVSAGLRALDDQQSRRDVRENILSGASETQPRVGLEGDAMFRELFVGLGVPFNEQGL